MAFTNQWMQTWWDLPVRLSEGSGTLLLWWNYTPALPVGFDPIQFEEDVATWFVNCLYEFLCAPLDDFSGPTGRVYLSGSGGILQFSPYLLGLPWIQDDVLPGMKGVIMRKNPHLDISQSGRMCVPGVRYSHVDGDRLNATGQLFYDAFAASLQPGFVSNGCAFTPSVVSYKMATITPVGQWTANPRLGTVHRRAKARYQSGVPAFPKAPPP